MDITDLSSFLMLSYLAHTAANISSDLFPIKDSRLAHLLREWLSSGFGVALAFSTGADLIADMGIDMVWPPAGLVITGILMGQGLKFGLNLLNNVPKGLKGKA